MSDVSFEDAIGHALTIIEGYTGLSFTGAWDETQFAAKRSIDDTVVNGTWISDKLPIQQGSTMSLMAKSVRVQINTDAYAGTSEGSVKSPVATDARGRYQVHVVMAFQGHTGVVFNTSRTIHFRGAHFFHFD